MYKQHSRHPERSHPGHSHPGHSHPGHSQPGHSQPFPPLAAPDPSGDRHSPHLILAAVDDLFFASKIGETARKLGANIRFVKSDKELLEAAAGETPSLIIVDLNSAAMRPLPTIVKLKADPQLKKTSVLGFLSHVQGELKQKAHEIGCDMVLARSAFSQNLSNLLKRHMSNRA